MTKIGINEYGQSLYKYLMEKNTKIIKLNQDFLSLSEKFSSADEKQAKELEFKIQDLRMELSSEMQFQKLFERYHGVITELKDTYDLIEESKQEEDQEMVGLL